MSRLIGRKLLMSRGSGGRGESRCADFTDCFRVALSPKGGIARTAPRQDQTG